MYTPGYMLMPDNFRYKTVCLRGRPTHNKNEVLYHRHPSMPLSQRAKIFSPFDALTGFRDAIASKDVIYEFRRELNVEDKAELNRRLNILRGLTYNGRMARKNNVTVTIKYYLPCPDKFNEAYGYRGQYVSITGIVRNIDIEVTHSVILDNSKILLTDIFSFESGCVIGGKNIFDKEKGWDDT